MQNIFALLVSLFSIITQPRTVSASQGIVEIKPTMQVIRENLKATMKDARNELKESILNAREEFKDKRASVAAIRKEKGEERKEDQKLREHGIRVILSNISSTKLIGTRDGNTVNISIGMFDGCITKIKRKYGGDSSIDELSVGDEVSVSGKFLDATKNSIEACIIRDLSIQKRFGVFVGEITSISANGFIMTTLSEKRADQTITLDSMTKIVNRNNDALTKVDLQVGQRVRVKGLWNSRQNTVTSVSHVKVFSLPQKEQLSGTPKPTVTTTQSVTPTLKPSSTPTSSPTPIVTHTPTPTSTSI